jgi:hypothetical protein
MQARGAPARIDAPLRIDVHRDGPEPAQLRQRLAILIHASDRLAVLTNDVVRLIRVGGGGKSGIATLEMPAFGALRR